jgi:hypothetical protein
MQARVVVHSDGSADVRFLIGAILDHADYPISIAITAPMFLLTMVIIIVPLSIQDRHLPHTPAWISTRVLSDVALLIRFYHDRD